MSYGLLITHYGSGASLLCSILNENPKISCLGNLNLVYDHPTVLTTMKERLNELSLRRDDSPWNWYVDKLVLNHQLSCKNIYQICKFIYFIREPLGTLPHIIAKGYDESSAADYYIFRLRRLCEMAINTPKAIVVEHTEPNLHKIESYLSLKQKLSKLSFEPETNLNVSKHVARCQIAYEKYSRFLNTKLS